MSEGGGLVVDGTPVRFVRVDKDGLRVLAGEVELGSLEAARGRPGYFARRSSGELLTRPSPWGGEVSARFGTKELAVRALLELG